MLYLSWKQLFDSHYFDGKQSSVRERITWDIMESNLLHTWQQWSLSTSIFPSYTHFCLYAFLFFSFLSFFELYVNVCIGIIWIPFIEREREREIQENPLIKLMIYSGEWSKFTQFQETSWWRIQQTTFMIHIKLITRVKLVFRKWVLFVLQKLFGDQDHLFFFSFLFLSFLFLQI